MRRTARFVAHSRDCFVQFTFGYKVRPEPKHQRSEDRGNLRKKAGWEDEVSRDGPPEKREFWMRLCIIVIFGVIFGEIVAAKGASSWDSSKMIARDSETAHFRGECCSLKTQARRGASRAADDAICFSQDPENVASFGFSERVRGDRLRLAQ